MPNPDLIIWPEMGTAEDILQKIIHNAGGRDGMKVWVPGPQQPRAAGAATGPGALR